MDPARVVGRIAVIFHAVGGKLRLLAGIGVPHPQVVIPYEGRALFVGGQHFVRAPATSQLRARVSCGVTAPSFTRNREQNRLSVGRIFKMAEWQMPLAVTFTSRLGECG